MATTRCKCGQVFDSTGLGGRVRDRCPVCKRTLAELSTEHLPAVRDSVKNTETTAEQAGDETPRRNLSIPMAETVASQRRIVRVEVSGSDPNLIRPGATQAVAELYRAELARYFDDNRPNYDSVELLLTVQDVRVDVGENWRDPSNGFFLDVYAEGTVSGKPISHACTWQVLLRVDLERIDHEKQGGEGATDFAGKIDKVHLGFQTGIGIGSDNVLEGMRAEQYQQTGPYVPIGNPLTARQQLLPLMTLAEQLTESGERAEDVSPAVIKRGLFVGLSLFLACTIAAWLLFEDLEGPLALAGWCMVTLPLCMIFSFSSLILVLPRDSFSGTGGVRLMQTIGVTSVVQVRVIATLALVVATGLLVLLAVVVSQG